MASSYSADLKLELMATGEKSGLWGDITNTNLTILQQAIAGYEEVSIAGGVQTTPLVFSNGLVSDGKNAVIKFIGTITGNQTIGLQQYATKANRFNSIQVLELITQKHTLTDGATITWDVGCFSSCKSNT
jgi:hypothetical protein